MRIRILSKTLFFLSFFCCVLSPMAAGGFSLTQEEKDWLSDHKETTLQYIIPPKYYPISFVDNGKPSGIVLEYIRILEEALGMKLQLVDVPWPTGLKMAREKEIDLLPCLSETPERAQYLIFTKKSYLKLPMVIVSRKDMKNIGSVNDLKGLKVSVDPNLAAYSKLKNQYADLHLDFVFRKTTPEVIRAVHLGDADACFVSSAVGGYLISQNGWSNLMISAETDWPDTKLRMAVRNDWPILAGIIEKVVQSIPAKTKADIFNKWVPVRFEHGLQQDVVIKVILPIIGIALLIISIIAVFLFVLSKKSRQIRVVTDQLAENRKHLDLALAASKIGTWNWNIASGAFFWDEAQHRIMGTDPTKDAPDFDTFSKMVHPEDAEKLKLKTGKAISGEEDFVIEYRIVRPDGQIRVLDVRGNVLRDATSEPVRMIGTSMDITERKQIEEALAAEKERLQEILDTSPVGVGISTDGIMRFSNPRLTELFNMRVGDPAPQIYVDPEDRDRIMTALKTKKTVQDYELQMLARNGEIRDILATYILTDFDGEEAVLGWMIDITEMKKANRELQEKYDEMDRFRRLAMGREEKMIGLKKEVNDILKECGHPEKYKIH